MKETADKVNAYGFSECIFAVKNLIESPIEFLTDFCLETM